MRKLSPIGQCLIIAMVVLAFWGRPPMVIGAQGDEMLRNPYGVIVVNPEKCPKVKADLAGRFVAWMAGSQGQALIGEFQLMNQQLFFPDAR